MDTRYTVIVLAFCVLLPGCLSTIFTFTAPSEGTIGEPFNAMITGSLSGKGPSASGIVMQIPKDWKVTSAAYHSNYGDGRLMRSKYVESLYKADDGYFVFAAFDTTSRTDIESGTLQVIVTIVPKTEGAFALKLVSGGTDSSTSVENWQSYDPRLAYDFATVEDSRHVAIVAVTEPNYSGGNAIALDGEEDYLAIPKSPGTPFASKGDFTAECWFRTTVTNSVIFSDRGDSNSGLSGLELTINKYGSPMIMAGDGAVTKSATGDLFVADGSWHHAAVTYNSRLSLMKLYVDGVCVDSVSASFEASHSSSAFIVGSRAGRESFFAGQIDELRIWNVERTERELQAIMNTTLTTRNNGLVAVYHFDETAWGQGKLAKNTQGDERLAAALHGHAAFMASTAPVFLESVFFTANIVGNAIELQWATSNETNLKGFLVEKRIEGAAFQELEFQPALRSNERQKVYSFTDAVAPDEVGVYYYRLKQLNSDGSVRYSDEIKVGTGLVKDFILEQNYPNPFNSKTTLSYTLLSDTYVLLRVFDLVGQEIAVLVNRKEPAGRYSVDFDATSLTSGIYIFKLQSEHFSEIRKMVLAK